MHYYEPSDAAELAGLPFPAGSSAAYPTSTATHGLTATSMSTARRLRYGLNATEKCS